MNIYQMVVMAFRRLFIAGGAAVAEIVTLQDAGILEQLDGAIDGGDGDVGIERGGAAVKLLGVGMILGMGKHARDHPALLGHAQALVNAEFLDPRHGCAPQGLRTANLGEIASAWKRQGRLQNMRVPARIIGLAHARALKTQPGVKLARCFVIACHFQKQGVCAQAMGAGSGG